MKQRCLNKKAPNYYLYGGRGISICESWLGPTGFLQFLADMGERPLGTSLGRTDNNGPYDANNCRWENAKLQASNRRKDALGRHPNSLSNLVGRGSRESALKAWTTRRANAALHVEGNAI